MEKREFLALPGLEIRPIIIIIIIIIITWKCIPLLKKTLLRVRFPLALEDVQISNSLVNLF
jgi:hypothetical protein